MANYIKKLPPVFQTTTEKKFFDATFDQVLSKKDSSFLSGYLGRRDPGAYQPITDFYIPEPSKDRTWWQLEATAYARNTNTEKSNIFFYSDLLEKINYYGGNTLNQDRLFESAYYSFGPPINYDMFVNYQNYYYIDQGLPTVEIRGVMASDIIGKTSYRTPPTAEPANMDLVSGMSISLVDDAAYSGVYTAENLGNCVGFQLLPKTINYTSNQDFEYLPWDGVFELANGRVVDNRNFDANTWDTQITPGTGDYITIQRGSLDANAWSRTNKWYSISAINQTMLVLKTNFPPNSIRALRPVIQFNANLLLYKSGTRFLSNIRYGFNHSGPGSPITRSSLSGMTVSAINAALDINLQNNDIVCFFADTTPYTGQPVNKRLFRTSVASDNTVLFFPYPNSTDLVNDGNVIVAEQTAPYDGAKYGQNWYYDNNQWQEVYNQKVSVNQAPLFWLFDVQGISLDDTAKYPNSTFAGNKIFSYKINNEPGARVDPVLRFPIVYTALGQVSDIVFQNNVYLDRYTYGTQSLPILGYYYYRFIDLPVLYNSWNLYQPCECS